jgi:uncharacterized membrane protein
MGKARLEAFSDGVFAVIITIMVLEIKVPRGDDLAALVPVVPLLAAYVLSFLNVGIYWNNHHHMLHATEQVDGRSLWANLHLLFWLSIVPVTTAWAGEHCTAPWPTALYGVVLLMAGLAYALLTLALVACNGRTSTLAKALGSGRKEVLSLVAYVIAIALAFLRTWIADAIYAFVAVAWLVPDRRIERFFATKHE